MKKKSGFSKILGAKGAGTVVTAFIGLIIIYIAFGILNPKVFSLLNIQNLLRSMSKYLLIGIGQSFVMITSNIDLSIGAVVGMSAMISATLMTHGVSPIVAIIVTLLVIQIAVDITRALKKISGHIEVIAEGNFAQSMDVAYLNRKDDFGQLSATLNKMRESVRELSLIHI